MAFLDKIRIQRSQPTPTKQSTPRFAPGWLAQNQRTAIRAMCCVLALSIGANVYQFKLREDIAVAPPETFAMMVDPDFSVAKVVNTRDLKVDELEALAVAEVKRFIYRLRRVADSAQVQENIDLMYCHATGKAAAMANRSFERGETPELVKSRGQRILSEAKIRAGLRPGERPKEDGMWITAKWNEEIDEGVRRVTVARDAEFFVKRFKDITPQLRACNPLGNLIVDYNLFDFD